MKALSKILVKGSLLLMMAIYSVVAAAETITVGTMAGPERSLSEATAKVAKEKCGLDVKIIAFNDYIAPNVALNSGALDVNVLQHKPYMESLNKNRGFHLVAVGNTFLYPIRAYSNFLSDIKDLKDGATIALPNDPTNEGRVLLLLDHEGYITLKDDTKLTSKVLDIASNPHHYHFLEMDGAQLPRVLNQVDIAFINSSFAASAGLDIDDALLVESTDSPYMNIIAARADNKDDEKVKLFVKSFESKEVEAAAEAAFHGGAIKGW